MKKHQPEISEGHINNKSKSEQKPNALREHAEKRLSGTKTPMPPQDTQKMLHELGVHQIELEMQNEALRQSQATLATSQERYADLYDFAPVGYFTFDSTGLITEANLTGASLLGVKRGELTNKPFSLFVAAPSQDTFHRHYRGVLKTGTAGTCEVQLTRKDGTNFYVSVHSVPVRDTQGNLTGVRSAVDDITERRQAEQALRDSEARYQRLVELSPDAILVHAEGKYVYVNPAGVRLFGARFVRRGHRQGCAGIDSSRSPPVHGVSNRRGLRWRR